MADRGYSLGALIAMGLGAWIIGLGMGGRVVARAYEQRFGPLTQNPHRQPLPPTR
jgi:hypothetical protein